jgi:hypothetical protein
VNGPPIIAGLCGEGARGGFAFFGLWSSSLWSFQPRSIELKKISSLWRYSEESLPNSAGWVS